jgi:hypothetical protein
MVGLVTPWISSGTLRDFMHSGQFSQEEDAYRLVTFMPSPHSHAESLMVSSFTNLRRVSPTFMKRVSYMVTSTMCVNKFIHLMGRS